MFKNIFVTMALAAMLVTSLPSEAGFGSSKSSSSSSSFRSTTTQRASTPSPQLAAPPRQVGGGGNVGMQRSAVTANVRNPAPVAPTYQRQPVYSQNTYRQPTYAQNTYQPQHTTVIHHYSPSSGGGGFGMGTIAMAAMGGYMLNGIMHDHSGQVYNGSGYTNGVPTQGGQYYTQPQAGDEQVQAPQQPQYAQPQYAPQPQVIVQQAPDSSLMTLVKILLWITGIAIVVALIRRIFL